MPIKAKATSTPSSILRREALKSRCSSEARKRGSDFWLILTHRTIEEHEESFGVLAWHALEGDIRRPEEFRSRADRSQDAINLTTLGVVSARLPLQAAQECLDCKGIRILRSVKLMHSAVGVQKLGHLGVHL
eukprot:3003199-Prymnesium_polylepis.2